MKERSKYIQEIIMNNIFNELKNKNVSENEYLDFFLKYTPLKETRIKALINKTNKREITIKELELISIALRIEPAELLKNII